MDTAPIASPSFSNAVARCFDICFAIAALAMLWPVILVIVIAILRETGAPVLFRQIRLGRGGRRFSIYKFRKFDARQKVGCPLTRKDDERLTPVGRVLAKTKLDELPQLLNILRGDMSVVGPRPESLAFADCFQGELRGVLAFRPGIFGPSQAMFRNEADLYPKDTDPVAFYRNVLFPRKASLDLAYYPNRSFLGDLGWVMRGILAVVGRGQLPHAVATRWPGSAESAGRG